MISEKELQQHEVDASVGCGLEPNDAQSVLGELREMRRILHTAVGNSWNHSDECLWHSDMDRCTCGLRGFDAALKRLR